MNKIPVFQVFKKWNNSKKGIYKNFPKDISASSKSPMFQIVQLLILVID